VQPGMIVAERFRLEKELGRGGMGSVWRAHHLRLDVPCAVKFIEGDEALMPELRARFEREARAAAKLRSPYAVQVIDHGEWEGKPYLVMELLDGEDLAKRLERVGQLRPSLTVSIVRDVARALDRAHALGIVHRDLKPENIFLVHDGTREVAKVVDFGIAKVDGLSLGDVKTRTGSLLGTPYYMSPEQAEGKSDLDGRSDLWALGVIAFECVTGKLAFDGDSLGDLLMRIIVRPLPVPTQVTENVPPAFDRFWERAARRDRNERFQSANELVAALAASLGVRVADEQIDTTSDVESGASSLVPSAPAWRPSNVETSRGRAEGTVESSEPERVAHTLGAYSQTNPGAALPASARPRRAWLPWAAVLAMGMAAGALHMTIPQSSSPSPAASDPAASPAANAANELAIVRPPPSAAGAEATVHADLSSTAVSAAPTASALATPTSILAPRTPPGTGAPPSRVAAPTTTPTPITTSAPKAGAPDFGF
jgi:serine/threonine protein kinase